MRVARRVFGALLLLYPRGYREQFGREMREVFELRLMASPSWQRFLFSEMAGVIAGAAREWFAPRLKLAHASAMDLDFGSLPNEVTKARFRVDDAVQKMTDAIAHHQFEQARRLAYQERIERERLRRLCDDYGIDAM